MRNTAFFIAGVILLLVQSNLFRLMGAIMRTIGWMVRSNHDLTAPGLVPSLVLPLILFMGVHEYSLVRGAGVAFALGYLTDLVGVAPIGLYTSTYVAIFILARAAGVRLAAQTMLMQVGLALAFTLIHSVMILVLLAIFEDTGLLPRIAFMVDGILHRVGLHGSSVVPLILGFGCNVPSIMATRTLDNPRDRFVTMMVAPFVTCSARSVVIIALAGKYLGVLATAALYLFGGLMSMAVSYSLTRSKRRRSLGVIMEVPPLRQPYPRIVARKVWMRLREFVLIAWPVLIVSSLALSLMSYAGMDSSVNRWLSPLTSSVLHLPVAVGIPLFLGLFRKELTLIMLGAALGTDAIGTVLSTGQILVLVVFTMLYVPCVATLAAQWREGGWRTAAASALLNLGVSIAVAGAVARLIPAV